MMRYSNEGHTLIRGLEQSNDWGASSAGKKVDVSVKNKPVWSSCPRCIGGNMYRETTGEFSCIQCGYQVSEAGATLIRK